MKTTHPLLDLARKSGNPVITGNQVTFVWKGKSAPCLITDIHEWEDHPQKLTRTAPDLWTCSLDLHRDAYLEYAFYDPRTKKRIKDPLNKKTVYNGIGQYNHFFYMPAASPTIYTAKRKEIPIGRITRHLVDASLIHEGGKRELHLYHPPVHEPVPLLLVYDGTDYLKRAMLNNIVDNLINEKRIRPIAMAFLQNGDDHRSLEYACSDATLTALDQSILPFASQKLNLLSPKQTRGAFGVLGASFGGLMSMYTGLRMPDIFGKVICQSGVFELNSRDFVAVDLIRAKQSREIAIWMDIGRFDSLLEDNRRLQPLLRENGYNVTYREANAGHNFTFWRNEIPMALEAMFPA
ncbi:MAG TPA: alpha/beta hydrolase-fold protein [Anaerolineales bacterium]|nr:alpha/beta hydrolase-fold protein [Anaerolineales bacterium]HNF36577.1 alpha/beta hydrolase-fold protein [Anaerolineales bacterium]